MGASILNFGDWAGYMLLITLRVLSTYMANPVFGKNVPAIAKIVLAVMISYLTISTLGIGEPLEYGTVIEFAAACLKEILLGITFGMIMNIMMSCVYLAGNVIDTQLGFGFSQMYDPITNINANLSSKFLNTVITLLFFATDSHHIMIKLIKETFTTVPPGSLVLDMSFVSIIVRVFVVSVNLGLRISMPILAVSFMTEVLLGVVMKSVPQINFFIIGFPIKIVVGLAVLFVMVPIFSDFSDAIFRDMFTAIQEVFEAIGT